jgi:uncharacterized membrane protein YkgB
MSINQELQSRLHLDFHQPLLVVKRVDAVAGAILRYGLVALLLLWGAAKFTAAEAESIRPLVEHSPFLAWLYSIFGARGGSGVIGVIEISAALLIGARRWRPALAALGSLLAAATFLITLSFLLTTPGIWEPTNPFGGFIMKDIILLGAALWSAAEALRGTTPRAGAQFR